MIEDEGNGRTSLLSRVRHHYLPSMFFIAVGIVLIAYAVVAREQGSCLAWITVLSVLSFVGAILLWGLSAIMEDATKWAEQVHVLSFWSPIGKVKRVTRRLLEREGWAFEEFTPSEYVKRGRNEMLWGGFKRRADAGVGADNSSKYYIFEMFGGRQSIHLHVASLERLRTTQVSFYPKEKAKAPPFASIIEGLEEELEPFEGLDSMPEWYKRNLERVTERYGEYTPLEAIPKESLEELERDAG